MPELTPPSLLPALHSPDTRRPITAFLTCLARDSHSQDLDCSPHVLPELQQEKLDLDTRRDCSSALEVGVDSGQQGLGELGFRAMGEGEATENLISCPSILLGN